ncbi:HD-GYP domain-containing protein [Dendrosporobacter sp. 1207_IL3150]|uniref:HD-GYP domain-containing protein n=1 Tax=Dendrosporobacter sp. 1207_IL3150 TaxID=3084054 RepID=UPI002FD9BD92
MQLSFSLIKQIGVLDRKAEAYLSLLNIDKGATLEHSIEVSRLALLIADKIESISYLERIYLRWGTLLHDIGKIDVGANILLKKGPLCEREFARVREHPRAGFRRAKLAGFPCEVANIILYHHERMDGKGYPYGVTGDGIPVLAKICSVADSFNAMVSNRSYRIKKCNHYAFQEMAAHAGKQFDVDIVNHLLELKPHIVVGGV